MAETLNERVRMVVAEVFDLSPEQVNEETTQKDVKNWDSMNILHLILALESEFGVTLDVDEANALTSVKAVQDVLQRKAVAE